MTNPATENLQKLFIELFPDEEQCRLDFSWSSIALLDLFLRPLRFRQQYNQNDLEIIKSSAIYCGEFLKIAFEKFGIASYQLAVTAEQVILTGVSPIVLFPQLVDRLQLPTSPKAYLVQYSTTFTKEESLLSNWIREIITEAIISLQSESKPAVELWKSIQQLFTDSIVRKALESSNQFPDWGRELITASPMLIPQFEISDLGRRYETFFESLKSSCTNKVEEWAELSKAFTNQADPELALFGTAVGVALGKEQIIVSSFSDRKVALETAEIVRNLQTTFFDQPNWSKLLNPNTITQALDSLNWERERGLTPFLVLDSDLIGFPILHQLFFEISMGAVGDALQNISILIPKAPLNIQSQLLLQQFFLVIELQDLRLAEEVASNISSIAQNLNVSEQSLFFYLCGRLQLILEEPAKARLLFQRALSFGKFFWSQECLIYFLSLCFNEGDYQTVVLLSGDSGFSKTLDSEFILLRILALEKVGRLEDAKSELLNARKKIPFNNKLFGQHLSTQLKKLG